MTIKNFEDYINEGVVRTKQPDLSRAKFLIEETKKSYKTLKLFIKNIKIDDNTANTLIKLCHDIVHELIRAIMLKKGYAALGNSAHEAEVSYLFKIGFSEIQVWFIDQLRYSRNSITYYGKILDKEYAEGVYNFLVKIYSLLLKKAEENS